MHMLYDSISNPITGYDCKANYFKIEILIIYFFTQRLMEINKHVMLTNAIACYANCLHLTLVLKYSH